MAIIQIWDEEVGRNNQIRVDLQRSVNYDQLGNDEYYLRVSTNLTTLAGADIGPFVVQDLTDVAPGAASPAADWTTLVKTYITYITAQSELGQSSSSSSSSSTSSSSSSDGYTTSSSSSSSSDGYTTSSSSSSSSN